MNRNQLIEKKLKMYEPQPVDRKKLKIQEPQPVDNKKTENV